MNVGQLAQIVVGAVSVLAVLGIATLGGVIRLSVKWGQLDERVKALGGEIPAMRRELIDKDTEIMAVVREDRRANNDRFNRVENRVFDLRPGSRDSAGTTAV